MNSRERVETTLNHREPDYIPSDLGATVMTSLNIHAYRNLRTYLKMPDVDIRLADVVQQLVIVDDDVRQHFNVDVTGVNPKPSTKSTQIEIKDDMERYNYFHDEWGIGWKMPKDNGHYFDVFHHPLRGDITRAEIDHFPWPDPTDPARFVGIREQVRKAAEVDQQAVIVGGLCAGFVEMAGWLRGYEQYLIDFATNPVLLEHLFEKILELKTAYWEKMLAEVGDSVTAVLESDDVGGQSNLLFSPSSYRQLVKPYHMKLYGFIKSHSRAKVFLHSCGAIRKVIPDMIDEGVDILNPVQVSAAGMDTAELKREFGKDLTFWGGGVDTQHVLGSNNVQEIRDEVRRRIEDLASGGGFVFATVHAIQGNIPPENVAAVWETLGEYGRY